MTSENYKVIDQFRTLLSSAILLKEKFDQGAPINVLIYHFESFLRDLDYLKKLVPEDILEKGTLLRHVSWIERRLNENQPDQCYGDIHDICFNDLFYIEKVYLNHITNNEEEIDSEIAIINKQLKLLDESNCDPTSWIFVTERLLRQIFPQDNINLTKLRTLKTDIGFTNSEKNRFREIVKGYIQEIELRNKNILPIDKWTKIHPTIARVARSRFETDHFGDSVESAFKELNEIIKKAYVEKKKKEEDGDSLMRKAFSVNEPTFHLADNSTESGRNIQQGYMDIFAGSMKGIRNPKAHANLDVHPDEAWEKIILASHLMRMWDSKLELKPLNNK
jgi:uncharacterized protein (TIGR02391 family)